MPLAVGKLSCTSPLLVRAMATTTGPGSNSVTVWLQVLVLPQASVASHVRVISFGSVPLVTVLRVLTETIAPLQASRPAGGSKLQGVPQMTILLLAQVSTGGLVFCTATV